MYYIYTVASETNQVTKVGRSMQLRGRVKSYNGKQHRQRTGLEERWELTKVWEFSTLREVITAEQTVIAHLARYSWNGRKEYFALGIKETEGLVAIALGYCGSRAWAR